MYKHALNIISHFALLKYNAAMIDVNFKKSSKDADSKHY